MERNPTERYKHPLHKMLRVRGKIAPFAPIVAVLCIGSYVRLCIDVRATQIILFIGFRALSVKAGQA